MMQNFKNGLLVALVLLCPFLNIAQVTISGYVEDAATGEKLISANIFDARTDLGTISNTYGFYSLTLEGSAVSLIFSYVGYQTQSIQLSLNKDTTLHIALEPAVELEEVEVLADAYRRPELETQMSQMEVPVEQIQKMPALLGEVDVLKSLQLLPGVQSGGEGQSGLYVRGGSPDQNLILLDGVPVYYSAHLLGFFSVFNADAIKNVTLTKGGFPARYGGRLSSVLEINMKEGNREKLHGEGSIGLVASKLTLEGPLFNENTTFLVSGRRTYIDLLAKPFINASEAEGEDVSPSLYFYDLNAKINHRINDRHRLYLSGYFGADIFRVRYEEQYSDGDYSRFSGGPAWGNRIGALRWNYLINNKLFANTTLTYSRYQIDIDQSFEDRYDGITESFSGIYRSGIEDVAAKVDFDYMPNPRHYIRFGGGVIHHTYRPGALEVNARFEDENPLDTIIGNQESKALEYDLYLEDDISLGALKINAGIHASAFQILERDTRTYFSVQPRLGLRYLLKNDVALKASFSTMTQFINLLTSESISLPTDFWVPSTSRIKPQEAWQAAIGLSRTFNKQFEVSVEAFYKEMDNVVSYKEGSSFFQELAGDWQNRVTQGSGKAYGVEFFVQKKLGRTTGWLGYTLSWNKRQFDEINGGREYPYRYDRRHDISLVLTHEINEKVTFSSSWVYGTGNAISLPEARYSNPWGDYRSTIQVIKDRNSFRMGAYHRLDVSFEFYKKKRKYERWWVIGAYNAYNRRNPYFLFIDNVFENGQDRRVIKQVSLFPVIPSVSYRIKF
jgi:outer membrane receptor for ferrienterochelin and colicin